MNIEALIISIFVKNALWDQKDAQHHNRFILDKLWDDVAEEMKSATNVVRAKWKTLRDTFREELRKAPVKRSGDGASQSNFKSSWQYFDSLCFLQDQFTARSGSGNLPSVERNNILEEDSLNTQEFNLNIRPSIQPVDNYIVDDQSPSMSKASQENRTKRNAATPSDKNAGKKLIKKHEHGADVGTALIRLEENKLRLLEQHQNKYFDEDESYFQSLLPHVRKLAAPDKMLLRIKMQELVYNFVYGRQQPTQPVCMAPAVKNVSHVYHVDSSPLTQLQSLAQNYSNPTSVASYLSEFSDEIIEQL